MTTTKRLEANRANALHSTGPRTTEGVLASKANALRHGLRALQAVVPGESPEEWEAHLTAVVDDLAPQGAVETALAEQVAAKLWRLGRVVRHESDLIANAQDPDEVRHAHEMATGHHGLTILEETEIPAAADVTEAEKAEAKAEERLEQLEAAYRQLKSLSGRKDGGLVEDWSLYEPLLDALGLTLDEGGEVFADDDEPFAVRHVRELLRKRGTVKDETARILAEWEEEIPTLREKADKARKVVESLRRRYESALERRRRAHGLPIDADLDKIQRYESHLERGLHKALDRLRALQEARRGLPPPLPSVTVAVLQRGVGTAAGDLVGSFGSFASPALEATGAARVADEG